MTVKELIAQLSALPQDAEVVLMIRAPKGAICSDEVETTVVVDGQVIVNGWRERPDLLYTSGDTGMPLSKPAFPAQDRLEVAEALADLYRILGESRAYNKLVEEHLDLVKDKLVADGWFDGDLTVR